MRIFTACKEMPRAPSGALSHHRKTPNRSSVFAFNRVHLKRLHRKHVRRRVCASATRAVKRKRNRSDTRSTTLPHPLRFERSKTAIERSTRRAAHPDAAFKHTPRIIASLKQKKQIIASTYLSTARVSAPTVAPIARGVMMAPRLAPSRRASRAAPTAERLSADIFPLPLKHRGGVFSSIRLRNERMSGLARASLARRRRRCDVGRRSRDDLVLKDHT